MLPFLECAPPASPLVSHASFPGMCPASLPTGVTPCPSTQMPLEVSPSRKMMLRMPWPAGEERVRGRKRSWRAWTTVCRPCFYTDSAASGQTSKEQLWSQGEFPCCTGCLGLYTLAFCNPPSPPHPPKHTHGGTTPNHHISSA